MPPLRRYLRLTATTALELRIHTDPASLTPTWLLAPPDPALPRVIHTIAPLILPTLRADRERRAGGKAKPKGKVTGCVEGDDFDVVLRLTADASRHALLKRRRAVGGGRSAVKKKAKAGGIAEWIAGADGEDGPVVDASVAVAVLDHSDSDGSRPDPAEKRRKTAEAAAEAGVDDEGEGKVGFEATYEGFAVYGRVLCLVVRRKGGPAPAATSGARMLEDWVATQARLDAGGDAEDE